MERERLLATIDEELSSGAPSKIQRVRLLDLWWRVATEDGLNNAKLGPADRNFLSHLVLRTARRSATGSVALLVSTMARVSARVGS